MNVCETQLIQKDTNVNMNNKLIERKEILMKKCGLFLCAFIASISILFTGNVLA